MQKAKHTEEHDALREGRVVLCHDHDKALKEALESDGGRIVGWVGGYYRIQLERPSGGAS